MSDSALPLAGRRALVAGASTGIGAATARRLLEAGAEVHGLARRGELVEQSLGAEAVAATLRHRERGPAPRFVSLADEDVAVEDSEDAVAESEQ